MNDVSYNNYIDKLQKANESYTYYTQPNIYKKIWIEEIDKLYIQMKDCLKNGFYKGDGKKKFRK